MKLGISLYPEEEKEADIRTYLSLASLYGCGRVFTSMFLVNEDVDIVDTFKNFVVVIVNNNMEHYKTEIQLVLKNMKNDGTRNYLGRV